MDRENIISSCRSLLSAYKSGALGQTVMPEDSNPGFKDGDPLRLNYFTLPMSLNYQRDSYKLWESALKTYNDPETRPVFDLESCSEMDEPKLRSLLMRYRLALQPNKHVQTWQRIAETIHKSWGSISGLIEESGSDFLNLKQLVQSNHKKGFPYLSGPKIFNYWSFIIHEYCGVRLKNSDSIDIAPDTHITRCSVRLGIISKAESETLSREEISARWRAVLKGSGIDPIQMHPPLWFWSRNGFRFKLSQSL
ncbi:MAG: hypothetical protein AABX47_06400 [Nanoarchaeota archaeon]